MDSFKLGNSDSFIFFSELYDSYVSKTSHQLVPGKKYNIEFYPINGIITYEKCLIDLRNKNALLMNAQGLTFLASKFRNRFPLKARGLISPDEKDSLPKDNYGISHCLTIGYSTFFKMWIVQDFHIISNQEKLDKNFYIVAFFEVKETTR